MDALICSKYSKKRPYTPLTLAQWDQDRFYFIAFGGLMTVNEIIGELYLDTDMDVYLVMRPLLLALYFTAFFFLKRYTLAKGAQDPSSKPKPLLVVLSDFYQVLGLSMIVIIDGISNLDAHRPAGIFFNATKFWVLLLFSIPTFLLLASKICFLVIILTFQGVSLMVNSESKPWKILLQAGFIGVTTVIIFFLVDRGRKYATSSYIRTKNQERTWRQVLEFLREGVTIIDKNGENVYGNKAMNKMLGTESTMQELSSGLDFSKIKNIKFHSDSKSISKPRNNGHASPMTTDSHLYENQLLSISLERSASLKDLIDFLRSKWVNTVDLLRKLSHDSTGCLGLDGEIEEQGIKTYVEVRISVLSFEDKNNLLIAVYDVTSRNLLNSIRELDKSRDKMTATISHQLLHPLNGSINYVRGALENITTPGLIREELLKPALNNMIFLTNTINDLVDLFNLNSNSLRMKCAEHSLIETIRDTIALIDPQANKKGLKIIRQFEISAKLPCYTDHQRLTQILLNLLSCSVRYTFKGAITVSIAKVSYKDFLIRIEDTGIGLSEDEKRKLLDDKGKIKSLQSANSDMLGENEVGLMISNELARKLGPVGVPDSCGIFCASQQENGCNYHFLIEDKSYSQPIGAGDHYKINIIEDSKFKSYELESDDSLVGLPYIDYNLTPKFMSDDCYYPRTKTMKSAKNSRTSRKSVSARRESSLKKPGQCLCPEVLLVDDDVFNMSSLEQIMSICHFSTFSSFNGLEAIREVVKRNEKKCGKKCSFFKLIFIEMDMPVMGGEEFISFVKDLMNKNEIPKVPIVACMKTRNTNEVKKAREVGAVECIIKPITKEKVLNVLEKLEIC